MAFVSIARVYLSFTFYVNAFHIETFAETISLSMAPNDHLKTTCLSCEEHHHKIHDYLLHFLGCIEISQEASFLEDDDHPVWTAGVEHHFDQALSREIHPLIQGRIQILRDQSLQDSRKQRQKWADNCRSELRRVRFLRATLAKIKKDKHLITRIKESGKAWRACEEEYGHLKNISKVRERRQAHRKPPGPSPRTFKQPDPPLRNAPNHEVGKDVNVPIIQFENCRPTNVNGEQVWGQISGSENHH